MARTELRIQEGATSMHANSSQMAGEVAAARISHCSCHKILSGDLNMPRVTQQIVPHNLTQDQRDDRMSTCGDLIDCADKAGTFSTGS
jgi:hypothetical protein